MSTYAIGDVQGCFNPLEELLVEINFDPNEDTLWFTGDLVNRGPQSLEVLRFVKALGDPHRVVLGNHDLHLLAVTYQVGKSRPDDTFKAILAAPDCEELMDWLRHRPLLCYHEQLDYVMVHAGMAPRWDLKQAMALANEVESILQSDSPQQFLQHMYGNQPDQWHDALSGIDRWRCITNYFTRMRFCDVNGRLELSYKGTLTDQSSQRVPWFNVPHRVNSHLKIIFGHWAALGGVTHTPNVYALDTGCVWGHNLTAMRLEDERRFTAPCSNLPKRP